ncbi:MAG: MBL fold metallo-hydrolase [Myxococcales bacterium]|nr:MBL fold metallo-hydrolase [Myxococcales bacterium]
MSEARLCVLGSGSRGNACLLSCGERDLLIDQGFSGRELERRLGQVGRSIERIGAVVLTHTHADHLNRAFLRVMLKQGIPLYCHQQHAAQLARDARFIRLARAGLVRPYPGRGRFEVLERFEFAPLRLPHDCPPTFGFVIEAAAQPRPARLAYLADLGHVPEGVFERILQPGVDVLALEFNHDEEMERRSRRAASLIERVLGPQGHLSNRQACDALERLLAPGERMAHSLIQLHISEECNDRRLAFSSAVRVVERMGGATRVFSTSQDEPGRVHYLSCVSEEH